MTTYQPYLDFTAQAKTVQALMMLYSQFEKRDLAKIELLPFVVFMAFAIEAYLNSVGARKIEFWDELERLPWRSKVTILHKHAGRDPDWGKEPLQFAIEVFRIRDKLAHGKPERVIGPICSSPTDADSYFSTNRLEPDWYHSVTPDWVRSAKERFRVLMIYIGSLYGLHESDHLHSASGGFMERSSDAA